MGLIVVPSAGAVILLRRTLKTWAHIDSTYRLRLYTNNYAPTNDSVLADFTEAGPAGYAQIPLLQSEWQTPVVVGGIATSYYGTGGVTFATSDPSPTTIYGYYVVDPDTNTVLWAQQFGVPVLFSATQPVTMQPIMRGSTC